MAIRVYVGASARDHLIYVERPGKPSVTVKADAVKLACDAYPLNNLGAIKLVRAFTEMDLSEAKEVVEFVRMAQSLSL